MQRLMLITFLFPFLFLSVCVCVCVQVSEVQTPAGFQAGRSACKNADKEVKGTCVCVVCCVLSRVDGVCVRVCAVLHMLFCIVNSKRFIQYHLYP
jgi:hypothetical protein